MSSIVNKGYSFLIRPLQIIFDLILLCLILFAFIKTFNNYFYLYLITSWLLLSFFVKFYAVYRFTSVVEILILIFKQSFLVLLSVFAYNGFVSEKLLNTEQNLLFVATLVFFIASFKFIVYFSLRKYRKHFGGNKRRIIVFGNSPETKELIHFFNSKPEMGYYVQGNFSNTLKQNISNGISLLKDQQIDELYCSIEELEGDQLQNILNHCDQRKIVLKFIPNNSKLPAIDFQTDYYHYQPVVSIPELSLHQPQNVVFKRFVDVVISIFVIVFILSWLTPLLFILVKLESKGPLFYKHKRNGINYDEFICYKFRSLKKEGNDERLHVSKEDERVTKIGRFLRRTSIDELPQFVNVLKGHMSIVGPRPHIPRYTKSYAKKIDKYQFVFRHSVRPGITGLAQTKGYRGEIKSDSDIVNRIKMDVFYIQNWSFFMDINIMFNTLILLIKGQDNAY